MSSCPTPSTDAFPTRGEQLLTVLGKVPDPRDPRDPRGVRYPLPGVLAAAVTRGLADGRHEGLNNKARTISRRSYGFHTPEAALALIMLACGPIKLELPHHT